jgi:hypothetical protein
MNHWWWSTQLSAIGLIGIYLAGRKNHWAWIIGLLDEALWIAYAITSQQWSFCISAIAYASLYARNLHAWHQGDGETRQKRPTVRILKPPRVRHLSRLPLLTAALATALLLTPADPSAACSGCHATNPHVQPTFRPSQLRPDHSRLSANQPKTASTSASPATSARSRVGAHASGPLSARHPQRRSQALPGSSLVVPVLGAASAWLKPAANRGG